MYFKKNWGSMAEKGPSPESIDIFQTCPSDTGNGNFPSLLPVPVQLKNGTDQVVFLFPIHF